jgi:type II secretory pathway pseudopilin PulG
MPNAGPVVIALVLVAIILGAIAVAFRSRPVAAGSIDEAYAVENLSQHTVMASVQLTLKNTSKKPITLANVIITLHTDQNDFSDEAASVTDYERYFKAYPELQAHSIEGLARGTSLQPGAQISGSILVSLPVTKQKFDTRRAITATVKFDGVPPMELRR